MRNIKKRKTIIWLLLLLSCLQYSVTGCSKASAPEVIDVPDKLQRQSISVLDFRGSSSSDHEMIQKAIDYAHLNRIPEVTIPEGTYDINAIAENNGGIVVKSNIHLKLDPKAKLKALPNGSPNYSILRVNRVKNVKISGGMLIGERREHLSQTGEWGMGIEVLSSEDITIQDIAIKNCWGDGIYLGGTFISKSIVIDNVICDYNRRQGLSVVFCDGLLIKNSSFTNTVGALPEAGIDVEPNAGQVVRNVRVEKCTFAGNNTHGFFIYAGTGLVSDIELYDCVSENNGEAGISLFANTPVFGTNPNIQDISIEKIVMNNNKLYGLVINDSKRIVAKDLKISGSRMGFRIRNNDDVRIHDFEVQKSTTHVFNIWKTSNLTIENGSAFNNNVAPNLLIDVSANVTVNDVNFSTGGFGVRALNSLQISVNNSTFADLSQNAVFFEGTDNASFSFNTFKKSLMAAVYFNNSGGNEFKNNTFDITQNVVPAGTGYVDLSGNSVLNVFTNNTIQSNTQNLLIIKLDGQTATNTFKDNSSPITLTAEDSGQNNDIVL